MKRPDVGAPDFGSPAFAAWRDATPAWGEYTRHAFVEGLSDGSLPEEAFLGYLIQDYLFLIHFSRAWALGVVKAGNLEEMRLCAQTVDALINHEMELHVRTCAAKGIDREELEGAQEHPANLAYTRYVLEAGFSGDFLDLMAALAPCVLGYGEIGARLAREASSTRYKDWIDTYSGEEYQAVCNAVGGLLEKGLVARLGDEPARSPRWLSLQDRFATATRLEVDFWEMGLA